MKIIAQKTNYNDIDTFFNQVIKEEYVDGVGLNVLYTNDGNLLIYSPNTSEGVGALNLQKNSQDNSVLELEEALTRIQNSNTIKEVMLNLIPVDYSVVDESSLKALVQLYRSYVLEVDKVISKFPSLDIRVYSINRNILTIAKEIIKTRKLGFYLYGGDLNPIDVDFYVFTPFMLDDNIFLEMLGVNKELYIMIMDNAELGLVTRHYASKYATAQSQRVLPYLGFIIAQPNIIERIFRP